MYYFILYISGRSAAREHFSMYTNNHQYWLNDINAQAQAEVEAMMRDNGDDIVTAEKWIKARRCHRSHLPMMDDALDRLYFPQYYRDDRSRVEQAAYLVIEDANQPSDETEVLIQKMI